MGITAYPDTLFNPERCATKPQARGNCLRFAATRLKFAATLGRLRPSAGMHGKRFNRQRFLSNPNRAS
jgi:hypothetical protein